MQQSELPSPRLPADLKSRICRAASVRVQRLLDALAHVPPGAAGDEAQLRFLLSEALDRLPPPWRPPRDAYRLLTGPRAAALEGTWARLRDRTHELLGLYEGEYGSLTDLERRHRLVSLTAAAAGAFIPALARAGCIGDAVALASAHLRLVSSIPFAAVFGAGLDGTGDERTHRARFILLSPVMWSLAAHMPII